MREFKFRAWDKENKHMTYNIQEMYDEYCDDTDNGLYGYMSCFTSFLYDENFIVMQYAGLKDKTGKEIYEGDICRWRDLETFNDEILEDIFVVVWNDEKLTWYTQNEDGNFGYDLYEYTDDRDLEVIGNIYENIDLLEVAEDGI